MSDRKENIDRVFKKLFTSISNAQSEVFHKSKEVKRIPKKMWFDMPLVCSDLQFHIPRGISLDFCDDIKMWDVSQN